MLKPSKASIRQRVLSSLQIRTTAGFELASTNSFTALREQIMKKKTTPVKGKQQQRNTAIEWNMTAHRRGDDTMHERRPLVRQSGSLAEDASTSPTLCGIVPHEKDQTDYRSETEATENGPRAPQVVVEIIEYYFQG